MNQNEVNFYNAPRAQNGYSNGISDVSYSMLPVITKKPGIAKRLIQDIKGIYQIYRHMEPRKTWDNIWMYRQYKREINQTESIKELHLLKADLIKGQKRLNAVHYERLIKVLEDKRQRALIAGGFVG